MALTLVMSVASVKDPHTIELLCVWHFRKRPSFKLPLSLASSKNVKTENVGLKGELVRIIFKGGRRNGIC